MSSSPSTVSTTSSATAFLSPPTPPPSLIMPECDEERVLLLQNSVTLHLSETLMLILSICALPMCFIGVMRCAKIHIFHVNIRIIGILHCVTLGTHCLGRILQHSTDLFLWLSPLLPLCEKRQYYGVCMVSQTMYNFGTYCSSLTTVFTAIERTFATKLSKKYENDRTNIGFGLVLIQIFFACLVSMGIFFAEMPSRPIYCVSETKALWALAAEFINLSANAGGLLQCYRLYNINMNMRIHGNIQEFTQKYQIEENKTIIRIIMRFTILDFIFMTIYFLASCFTYFGASRLPEPLFLSIFELWYCGPIYVFVVLSLVSMYIKKTQAEKNMQLVANVHVKDDAYFHFFKRQWT